MLQRKAWDLAVRPKGHRAKAWVRAMLPCGRQKSDPDEPKQCAPQAHANANFAAAASLHLAACDAIEDALDEGCVVCVLRCHAQLACACQLAPAGSGHAARR